ncbi:PRC-barrel domain-containing protein [Dongia soli]|uniref:PRC-barrel domain-containing protein n=1 Tax=Dongia soli TaxID=600628 RepID=A0ABU5EH40_9PROT|nr:PRC-barrel domain-containing protein [Dongia soli]MDY0885551.1 PRC-barrel domain-containing protein [Dongia soli]
MLKRFLLTTAVLSVAAMPVSIAPALAQDSNQPTTTSPAPAPAPTPSATPDASTSTTAEAPTPPPGDAIIAAESSGEIRADKLIGMKVYNADGKEVGKVKDVLFDRDGTAKGVVLSVGGVLGIGAKPVGLQWKEIDLQPERQAVKVNYSKEQLEAAPSFKTQEAQASEMNSANQSGQPSAAPSPSGTAPAPSGSGSSQ